MQTGSLVNILLSKTTAVPTVGMGATVLYWTDRRAATVVAVSASGRTVTIQEDRAVRTDKNGMSECQDYEYTPNPEAPRVVFTLRKNGQYVRQGQRDGSILSLGRRETYHDFSF